MFTLLQRLTAGRPRITTAAGFADFLAGRAAFVSQKSTLDYCRARAGIGWVVADASVAAGLGAALRAALLRHPVPAHHTSWDDEVEAAQARLHRALLAAPREVHRIGSKSGGRVFEVLPIHTNLKAHDREMVVNNIRFLLCRVYANMERELDGPALIHLLNAPPGDESQLGPR